MTGWQEIVNDPPPGNLPANVLQALLDERREGRMRFWDSSAIVPLICLEQASQEVLQWYREDSPLLIWAFIPTEVLSALYRQFREGRNGGFHESFYGDRASTSS